MVNSPHSPSDVRLSLRGHRRGRMSFLPIIQPLKWMILPRPCTVHNRQLATGVEMAPLLTSKRLLEPHYGECDSLMITASLWAIMGIETSASWSWDSHRAMKWTVCAMFSLLDHLNERRLLLDLGCFLMMQLEKHEDGERGQEVMVSIQTALKLFYTIPKHPSCMQF